MTELPEGWAPATVGDVCDGVTKVDPSSEADVVIAYIDISGVDGEAGVITGTQKLSGRDAPSRARQLVTAGDVVVSTVRTYMRKSALVPPELAGAVASTGFSVLRPTPSIDPRLLFHAVRHPDFVERLSAQQTGSSYPAVRDSDVRAMPLLLPPLAEQERIVAAIEEAFSKLDAGEAELRIVRQLLKRMRDAILAAAVTGRLVPQDPTDTPTTKLLADLGMEALQSGGATDIPPGWVWTTVGELGKYINGRGFKKSEWATSGRPIIRIQNLTGSGSGFNYFASPLESRYVVPPGALLVSWAATLGVYRWAGPEGALNQHIFKVESFINEDFHRLLLEYALGLMQEHTHGSGMVHITRGRFDATPVRLPPTAEQERIVGEVDRRLSFVEACERAVDVGLARSAALRRSVLKAAFEGRLVPQDPSDEPAAVLLERIRAERAAQPAKTRGRKKVTS